MSIDEMVNLTNIGTLFALCWCVLASPFCATNPGRHRPFRVPLGALVFADARRSLRFLMYYLRHFVVALIAWLMIGLSFISRMVMRA